MRKLRAHEWVALRHLEQRGSICIGPIDSEAKSAALDAYRALHKLRLALVEHGDDGPIFAISPLGRQKLETFNE